MPPCTVSAKAKPSPRARGRDIDRDVAELAVAARLLLVPPAHRNGVANGFAIGDRGLFRFERHAESGGQPLDGHAKMHLALAEQLELARFLVVKIDQRRIFLA